MVSQARAWIGKKESDGTHRAIVDLYNGYKPLPQGYKVTYTDSWCATFVSACAIAVGADKIMPLECSCQRMIALAQKSGIWEEADWYVPKAGDIILYDWQDLGKGDDTGWADHVGLVEECDGTNITVIEGNLNDAVGRRKMKVDGRYIRGYITPRYDAEKTQKPLDEIARDVINGKYGTGQTRKDKLKAEGYDPAAVQARVNELLKTPAQTVSYYPRYTGTSRSLVDALASLKIDASFAFRGKIAKANGITLYLGTAAQNTKLLNLLKEGILKR